MFDNGENIQPNVQLSIRSELIQNRQNMFDYAFNVTKCSNKIDLQF